MVRRVTTRKEELHLAIKERGWWGDGGMANMARNALPLGVEVFERRPAGSSVLVEELLQAITIGGEACPHARFRPWLVLKFVLVDVANLALLTLAFRQLRCLGGILWAMAIGDDAGTITHVAEL